MWWVVLGRAWGVRGGQTSVGRRVALGADSAPPGGFLRRGGVGGPGTHALGLFLEMHVAAGRLGVGPFGSSQLNRIFRAVTEMTLFVCREIEDM